MKLFQQLLIAPAALGLMAPLAVSASELNIQGIDQYSSSQEQITSIDQFPDVKPTDWAYQALSNLIERYGCVAGYPDGTFRGGKSMTRYEAAALLNACLDRVTELTDELKRLMKEFESELAILRGRVDGIEAKVGELEASQFSTTTKLSGKATFVIGANSYGGEATSGGFDVEASDLPYLVGVGEALSMDPESTANFLDFLREGSPEDNIPSQADTLEFIKANLPEDARDSFDSLTPSEQAELLDGADLGRNLTRSFALAAMTGGRIMPGDDLADRARALQGATTFNYDVQLDLDTSFTGKDLLRTRLRSGNFVDSAFGGPAVGLNSLEVAFEGGPGNDVVEINRLFYQFPLGSNFTASIGGRVRQDDMLAMWPSAYPSDTILDFFTYAGAPGAYSLNLGGGGGLSWEIGGFNVSVNYVSANGDSGSPNLFEDDCGGIGNDCSAQTGTGQIGYSGNNWGIAAAYTYTQSNGISGLYAGNGTPIAVTSSLLADDMNSVGVSAYWQPEYASWFPGISLGWGINTMNSDDYDLIDGSTSQSWYVGIQWQDVFWQGNALGMAVGQPTFLTSSGDDDLLAADDGQYAWEWWYQFQVTDNISVTPALYYLSAPYGQLQKNSNDETFTNFGGLLKTTFRF